MKSRRHSRRHFRKRGNAHFSKYQTRRKMRGGKRLAGHVNPRIYDDEYQMVMHLIDQAGREQGGYPRFTKMKAVFAYLINSEEVLKNKRFRQTIRNKINEIYGEQHKYVNDDREFAEMVQVLIGRINDLDARNVRHEIPN